MSHDTTDSPSTTTTHWPPPGSRSLLVQWRTGPAFELARPSLPGALCKGVATGVFFPDPQDADAAAEAKEFCTHCPVRLACLAAAMEAEGSALTRDRYGIHGGLDPAERYSLYRRRLRAAARARQTTGTGRTEVAA